MPEIEYLAQRSAEADTHTLHSQPHSKPCKCRRKCTKRLGRSFYNSSHVPSLSDSHFSSRCISTSYSIAHRHCIDHDHKPYPVVATVVATGVFLVFYFPFSIASFSVDEKSMNHDWRHLLSCITKAARNRMSWVLIAYCRGFS